MNVLVTGGAGFIGSHLVEALLAAGHQVTVVDNLQQGKRELVPEQAAFQRLDIRDRNGISDLFDSGAFDVVFHEAALPPSYSRLHPEEDADVTIMGLLHILENCCRTGVQKIIVSSTAAVYGNKGASSWKETDFLLPASVTGVSKAAAEQYVQLYQERSQLSCTILRYANVYGERQEQSGDVGVVGTFARAIAHGRELTVYGDGEQSRDFVHVSDVAAANLAAMEAASPPGIYNISTNIETTVNALKEILFYFAQIRTPVAYEEARSDDVPCLVLDNAKAKAGLHWRPKTKLLPGLMDTFSYYLGREE